MNLCSCFVVRTTKAVFDTNTAALEESIKRL